jgi:hypothetical protein
MENSTYNGSCFCGAVQFTVTGEPVAMGYCHCDSCRKWSAGPVNAFTLWKPEAVRVTRGAENIGTFNKTPKSYRKWCKTCGGHLFTEHPQWALTDVYSAVHTRVEIQAGRPRELPGNGAPDQGRRAEAKGRPEGNGRLGHHPSRVSG